MQYNSYWGDPLATRNRPIKAKCERSKYVSAESRPHSTRSVLACEVNKKKKNLHFSLEGNCFFLISLIKTTCNLAECQTGWCRRGKTRHEVKPSESEGFERSRRMFDCDRCSRKIPVNFDGVIVGETRTSLSGGFKIIALQSGAHHMTKLTMTKYAFKGVKNLYLSHLYTF